MKMLLQVVSRAEVRVSGSEVASIGRGLLVFVAVERGDPDGLVTAAADKIAGLRIFPGPGGAKMDLSTGDAGGEILLVSQFTLAASLRRGRRPSFDRAAPPETAAPMCAALGSALAARGLKVATGVFGAAMAVELVNDGPVTFWLESDGEGAFGP
ncbi:MAG: D-tyrosyl-tRNA(Tyr) deacylase [Acidobacteria bacterium]|nr:D-tyrosyl-tRNA(Tyr) deacylase [Acidobacteriota bacterium]